MLLMSSEVCVYPTIAELMAWQVKNLSVHFSTHTKVQFCENPQENIISICKFPYGHIFIWQRHTEIKCLPNAHYWLYQLMDNSGFAL